VEEQQELSADTPLGKYAFKGASLHTLACVVGAVAAVFACVLLYQHTARADVTTHETLSAFKELTSAIREQTCLSRYEQKDKQQNADFCKQISR
jgi:hypothetical protein